MKQFSLLLATFALLFSLSCKSGTTEAAEEPIAAASFKTAVVIHQVKDFDAWKSQYMAADSMKKANGLTHLTLGRGTEDPNMIFVANIMADVQKAREFIMSPDLKARMDSSGVVGQPTFHYIDVVRFDSTESSKDRLIVWHKVKDYDVWLKAYDGEGRKMRMEHGLVDRALGRGVDDPNMVYIGFAVTDKAKATARFGSEDLKKIMTDAGVEGQPEAFWYNVVD